MVQADPSFDEMKEVVVMKKMRPSIHNQWKSDEVRASTRGGGGKGHVNIEGDGGEGCDSVNTSSACTLFCCS